MLEPNKDIFFSTGFGRMLVSVSNPDDAQESFTASVQLWKQRFSGQLGVIGGRTVGKGEKH